jgi:hypothetical protein
VEDDGVLTRFQHQIEVTSRDRFLGPPAVDNPPLLAQQRNGLAVDAPWSAV